MWCSPPSCRPAAVLLPLPPSALRSRSLVSTAPLIYWPTPTLKALLESAPLIVPTDSIIRAGFENLVAQMGISPRIVANVDDMAMVRLLAREGAGVAIAPAVVMADEIAAGILATAPFDLNIKEPFYAVTLPRTFTHPALAELMTQA